MKKIELKIKELIAEKELSLSKLEIRMFDISEQTTDALKTENEAAYNENRAIYFEYKQDARILTQSIKELKNLLK